MKTQRFDKSLLPPARSFYEREIGQLTREDRKGWAQGNCPFHESKSRKSFSVGKDGQFFCHGCNVRGGDVVAFLMQRDHLSFREACQRLGAWRDGELDSAVHERLEREKRERTRRERELREKAARERDARLSARDFLHALEGYKRDVISRMHAAPEGSSEREQCWELLALLEPQIREQEQIYMELADLLPKPVERGNDEKGTRAYAASA